MASTKRITTRVLAGLTLVSGVAAGRAGAQSPADLLARKPVQAGVQVTTPAGADLAACKAEAMSWPKAGPTTPTGVKVTDAGGKLVRQFVDTTGRNSPNIFSFYLNGVETYRELDTNGNGKPDQFRWLGANGSKWGSDKNEDGVIDQWYVLSPEELSQELFQVIVNKDGARLAALIATPEELKAAGLPDAEAAKITKRGAAINNKVNDTIKALALAPEAKWVHVEVGVPQTTPGDAVGSQTDLVTHKSVTVLFDKGDGKSADVFQTGELVLVGRTWKLVDGPAPGNTPATGEPGEPPLPEAVQKLIVELQAAKTPVEKAAVCEKIVAITQGAAQEPWLRQMVEHYTTAAETGDAAALARLKQWQELIVKTTPGSANAGFVAFRVLNAEYAGKMAEAKADVAKVQTWWREGLEAFVKAYPAAEDTPDAMIRLAVAFEFTGKDGEAQAKTWYETMAKTFPADALAAKARGAIKRLGSEGTPFELAGSKLNNGGEFTMAAVKGKPTVVVYWASWGRDAAADLKVLADLGKAYGAKGLEVVTVSLDTDPAKASAALAEAGLTGSGFHNLFAPGGLDGSPLAAAYGIQMAPHVFLVNKDGNVVSKNAQTGPVLKDEVEKLMK